MTESQVIEFLESHTWTFAKTMPWIPHWYIVRKESKNEEIFELVVDFIQKNGIPFVFGRKTYIILIYKGFRYWTMGFPPKETTIINRTKHNV